MIKNVMVQKNPWPAQASGPAMMKRIPNAPSKGIMLDRTAIDRAIVAGGDRARRQLALIRGVAQA